MKPVRKFLFVLFGMLILLPFAQALAPRGFTCAQAGLSPVGPSCEQVACTIMDGGCENGQIRENVIAACAGNLDGRCLKKSCEIMGVKTCSALAEIQVVAPSCQGACDASCSEVGCSLLGCSSSKAMSEINLACTGQVRGTCVSQNCQNTCKNVSEFTASARSCGGQM